MNYAQFLIGLGIKPKPAAKGHPCPAYIADKPKPKASAMIETKEEVSAFIDSHRGVSGRALPSQSIGATMV